MDRPTEENSESEAEERVDKNSDPDLIKRKWKARLFLILGVLPAAFVAGAGWQTDNLRPFLPGDISIAESNAMSMVLIAFLIMTPLLAIGVYHDHKYRKATGKKWWQFSL
ncbi:MAG: hypothetical protein IH996_06725 [Proteobacteria bacterium]|nr:hypothetical protein [Pseudomonadota bacterium]